MDGLCRMHFDESDRADKAMTSAASKTAVSKNSAANLSVLPTTKTSQHVGHVDEQLRQKLRQQSSRQYAEPNTRPNTRPNPPYQDHSQQFAPPASFYPSINDQLNDDVVEGDVSLASVAKDLGFDGRELTDMLDRLPVEEALVGGNDDGMGDMDGNDASPFLGDIKSDEVDVQDMDLGHSWADVDEFLNEEGYLGYNMLTGGPSGCKGQLK